MIIDHRTYTFHPLKLQRWLKLYQEHGLPIQKELLGTFHGYFTSETAELNHVVAWWSYESLDDRLVRRDRMMIR